MALIVPRSPYWIPQWQRVGLRGRWFVSPDVGYDTLVPTARPISTSGGFTKTRTQKINLPAYTFVTGQYANAQYPLQQQNLMTLTCWANISSTSYYGCAIDLRLTAADSLPQQAGGVILYYDYTADKWAFYISGASAPGAINGTAGAASRGWAFLCGRGFGNDTFELLENGVSAGTFSSSVSGLLTNPSNVKINQTYDLANNYESTFSDLRIYDRALTDQEVLALYAWRPPIQRPMLVGTVPAAGGVFNPYFYRQHIAGGMHGESS